MLRIFNDLSPFFNDNYQRIHVREYARVMEISPPTASKRLSHLNKQGLLNKEEERNIIYYHANKESKDFIDLSRIYWRQQLKKAELIKYLNKELINPLVILFGSFSKAEVKHDSDIDLAVFTHSSKKLNLTDFEKRLGRSIQLFTFKSRDDVNNKELLNNLLNGYIITGNW
ncbi:hypothetical protein GF352_02060 [archaeon]|nr:hypothetical protein [archaeon]